MRAAVIDPGGDLDRIEDAIKQSKVTVERILLTHGHIDHAAAAAELKERLGVPIEGPHRADQFLLDHLPETGSKYGIDARAVTPDRWLEEGDEVTVGDLTFGVLHCPGHSPGSVVFTNAAQRFAIVGDVLFQGSVGRTDLPGGDHDALIRSIKEKLLPLGDDVAFICGHGPGSTIGDERRSNPFLQ
jgi:glyoxylase-like metal-dependent hydrolase (beta-lactamase superfamily II)